MYTRAHAFVFNFYIQLQNLYIYHQGKANQQFHDGVIRRVLEACRARWKGAPVRRRHGQAVTGTNERSEDKKETPPKLIESHNPD